MPATIKIYPPTPLPDKGVSETQFNIWTNEIEVYLEQESDFAIFLPGGKYENWLSHEVNPDRIANIKPEDRVIARERDVARNIPGVTQDEANRRNTDTLQKVRRGLRTVLSIIGKCVSEGHYVNVTRHSTSLAWIYQTLRQDYDIMKKGIHFFNILDVKYDGDQMTPVTFYNQYRTAISNNLGKSCDVIKYKDNLELNEDEKMTPMLEDLLLLNVIREIDPRLPTFVKTHYNHKMKRDERLMDFKSDILVNIPTFLEQLNTSEQNNSIKVDNTPSLNAFKPRNKTKAKSAQATAKKNLYCRLCFRSNKPRDVYTSHNFGDEKCSEISNQDRLRMIETLKLSNIQEQEPDFIDEDELAEMHGYSATLTDEDEVKSNNLDNVSPSPKLSRNDVSARCSYIKPVPSQILTMYQDSTEKIPIHIDLDSGANLNFCRESEVLKCGFKIFPNGQTSSLGDGITKIKAVGEIHEYFFRNGWKVQYNAVVCKDLTAPFIGGTVFLKENGIDQDLVRNKIHIHNKEITVNSTDPVAILPTAPILSKVTHQPKPVPNKLLKFESRILLPGQKETLKVEHEDGSTVAVEPFEQNNNLEWPKSQLQTVINGRIHVENDSSDPICLGKDVKQCRVRTTTECPPPDPSFYPSYIPKLSNIKENEDNISHIKMGSMSEDAKKIIDSTHEKFSSVFDKNLKTGYNGYFGKHECTLNWATSERPIASKVRVPSYNHDLKSLQQELMDELTDQGVLLVPQDHDITVQSVCPSFIQRKQRAKDKPKQALTKSDVRLLINFGPINDKIKPPPIHVPKTDDIMIQLGRWKHIIIFDLYNGYFQVPMAKDAIPWLGVQTPFGGLRVISRSGQGLLGMAEEIDELTAKVLKEELKDGICTKIADDIYVGGDNQVEAALNYLRVIGKLALANLKIAPEKTHIFPKSADVLGWTWKEGGRLEASPHRKFALANTKTEDIRTVKDMRSWIGLFKTLHIVTPKISLILSPFESATAGRDSKEKFSWTHELETQFRDAKEKIDKLVTLYLPSPDDQLYMETDAAKGGGQHNLPAGIGHILFVVKNGEKLPVRIHSAKLPEKCQKWSPCEIEALALAAGVDKEYDLIRESKHPLMLYPDSKPVHEAIKLVNEGKFSTSARMSSFLTNINRTKIESKHISGKAKLNPYSDLQSRIPAECNSEVCSIHKFINEAIDSVVDEGAKNCKIENDSGFSNRISWRSAQNSNMACTVATKLLTSGKPPPKAIGKNTGEYWNDVRQYCRDASVARDGLLVVKTPPDAMSGNIARERIVVPKPLVPALLYHMHNHNDQHPTKSQQKANFQRHFYAIHLEKHLELLYRNCYKCSVIQKLPKQIIPNETKTVVNGPQTHFHADVIKRSGQNILTVKDHFSSYQDAALIKSETSADLKEGLIQLTSAMRRPLEVFITVDNAPGFKTLLNNVDTDLKKLQITMVKTDEINKNSNAVVDRGCQELEEELKRLEPEGDKLSSATLKLAVLNLNRKLRRRGNISAYEINSSRDQNTGDNMKLDDKVLRSDQIEKRKDEKENLKSSEDVNIGDTVTVANKNDKHKAKEMYIVTSKDNDNVGVQKLLHTLKENPKIMSKVYKTKSKHLVRIHKATMPEEECDDDEEDEECPEIIKHNTKVKTSKINSYNPINSKFFEDQSDEENDDENNDDETIQDTLDEENFEINNEVSWDSSPEQYALGQQPIMSSVSTEGDDESLQNVLQPRRLFSEHETSDDQDNLTTQDSDDEVFNRETFETPPTEPRLKRQNAFRLRRTEQQSYSEPRITRKMLLSRQFPLSNPTSPRNVETNEVQNLENVLNPRVPLVEAAVDLGQAQVLDRVLEQRDTARVNRRSARNKSRKLDSDFYYY